MKKTSNHYGLLLLDLVEQRGLDGKSILLGAGMSEEGVQREAQWIDNQGVAALIKALWNATDDEAMGLSPEPTQMGVWALVCDYMIAAETLGELYRRGAKIYALLNSGSMGVNFFVNDSIAEVHIDAYVGEQDPHRFLMEFITVTWHRFSCWAIDEYIPLSQVSFTYKKPPHHSLYDEIFQCPIAFSRDYCGYTFTKKYLSSPIRRTRQELNDWLRNSPFDLLYMPGRDNTMAHYIKQSLIVELRQTMQFSSFDRICENLHMSSHVVRRRLDEEGSSYQKIKDSVRLARIKELLNNVDCPISEISERSGFTEHASLARAFKKWTGMTPAQYRKKIQ